MADLASLRLAGLLASRLCHDLVGPLGAVDNGLELISEGGGMAEEALALALRSSKRATGRLQYFRFAFGAAGEDASFGANEARGLVQVLIQGTEIQLDWPSAADGLPPGAARLLLNMILLAIDCLPRGGRIQVAAGADRLAVECTAPLARMTPELKSAIGGSTGLAALTARTVVGHYAALLAVSLGGELSIQEEGTGKIRLQARLGRA